MESYVTLSPNTSAQPIISLTSLLATHRVRNRPDQHSYRHTVTTPMVANSVSVRSQSAPADATFGAEATAGPRSLRSNAEKTCRARRSALSGRKYTSV